MGLETATHIDDLNSANPVGASDSRRQGDDHIRLIKKTIQNSFPKDLRGVSGPSKYEKLRYNGTSFANMAVPVFQAVLLDTYNIGGGNEAELKWQAPSVNNTDLSLTSGHIQISNAKFINIWFVVKMDITTTNMIGHVWLKAGLKLDGTRDSYFRNHPIIYDHDTGSINNVYTAIYFPCVDVEGVTEIKLLFDSNSNGANASDITIDDGWLNIEVIG